MPGNGEMTIAERRKYLGLMGRRYAGADRATKGQLLDEMEQGLSVDELVESGRQVRGGLVKEAYGLRPDAEPE